MRRSRIAMGMAPAVGFTAIPVLTCPACLPTLASALGAVGLTFLAQRPYLLGLNLAALVIALILIARGGQGWVSWPLGIATAGAAAILLGKFVWPNSVTWRAGLGVFLLGSLFSGRTRKSNNACKDCQS